MRIHNKSSKKTTSNKSNHYFIRNRTNELKNRFKEAVRGMGPNHVGTQLNSWQTEFSYLIHDANTGPVYTAPGHLMKAESLIKRIKKLQNAHAKPN